MPVPATPINHLRRWELDIQCSRCRRHVRISIDDVLARHVGHMTIGEVLRRLRCGGSRGGVRCNAKPSRVKLAEVSKYGKSFQKLREITVVGG
jgi:hypothetical protein